MLVEVAGNLLVEPLVALIDVADIFLLKLDSLSFIFLLFNPSLHFVGEIAGTLTFAGFVRCTRNRVVGG